MQIILKQFKITKKKGQIQVYLPLGYGSTQPNGKGMMNSSVIFKLIVIEEIIVLNKIIALNIYIKCIFIDVILCKTF